MSTTTNTPLRLRPIWADKLRALVALKAQKKETAAAAAAADNAVKAAQGEILLEMGEATAAVCGNMVVAVKVGADSEKTLTLATGVKIPLSKVTSITVGNQVYKGSEIIGLYGGRAGGVSVEISGG